MNKRNILKAVSVLLCFVLTIVSYAPYVNALSQPDAQGDTVSVVFLFAFFRSKPNLSLGSIKGILFQDREVKVLGYSGNFVYVIDVKTKQEGYIHYLMINDKPLNIVQEYANIYNGAYQSGSVRIKYDKEGILEWYVNKSGIVEVTKCTDRSLSIKGISPGTVTLTVKCGSDRDTCSISCINQWKETETAIAKSTIEATHTPGNKPDGTRVIPEGATIIARGNIPSNNDYLYVSSGNVWGFIKRSDFSAIKYMMTQYHYYDKGYALRFSSAETKIYDYASVLNDVMMANFNLKVCPYVQPYTSAADQCKIWRYGSVTANNLASSCPQNGNHNTDSCMRTRHIRDVLLVEKGWGTDVITKAVWTGHIMDSHKGDRSNSESRTQTLIFTTGNTVNSNSYTNKSASAVKKSSIYEIVHETSHQLSAPDHYCYKKEGNSGLCENKNCEICYGSGILPDCIMGKIIYPTDTYDLYCEDCSIKIKNHLNDHH